MPRRLVVASAIAVVAAAAFLPGSGLGSSAATGRGAQGIPLGLADAIHARFGGGAIRSSQAQFEGPRFGFAVALSADGTTALVGAPYVGDYKGAAYVFHVSGAGSWSSSDTPSATLMSKPVPARGQFFGLAVALSADGSTAFVSAFSPGHRIYVFHVPAEDAWASSSTPTATLQVPADPEALALSADGATLLAGAPGAHSLAGAAYVFHASGEDAWASSLTPTASLTIAGESPTDYAVGFSVAISGDGTTALLSDPGLNGVGAYVFHVSADDVWTDSSTPTAVLSDANADEDGGATNSVALSGDGTVALLADHAANSHAGAVEVFHASGEAAWVTTSTPAATLTVAGGTPDDFFGLWVAVSADGTTVFATAPSLDYPRGGAYIFRASGEAAWASSSTPTATLVNSGGHVRSLSFGIGPALALSADGTTAIDGAAFVEFETGAADVFHVSDASSWASSSAPTAVLTNSKLAACVVPRLIGLKLSRARSVLKVRHCRLGRVTRVVHAHARRGRVVSQRREADLRLHVGAKVAVKVKK